MIGYTDIIFHVKDEHVTRLLVGLARHYGWRPGEGESQAAYVKRKIREEWVQRVQRAETMAAIEAIQDQEPILVEDDA